VNWDQVAHVLRAAASIAAADSFVVIGSQSVLLSHPYAPEELLVSRELDLYPAMHPERADLIDGAIGAGSQFHETFGYYADGVSPETAVMPADWMKYSQLHYIGDITVVCPDLHDIAVSKSVAGRDKDAAWVSALLRHHMIEPARLIERLEALDAVKYPVARHVAWARRRITEAQA
jgi:hypothetical protein